MLHATPIKYRDSREVFFRACCYQLQHVTFISLVHLFSLVNMFQGGRKKPDTLYMYNTT